MCGHACHRQSVLGQFSTLVIVATAPIGVSHHRLPPDFVERDILRGMESRRRDRHRREAAFAIARRPLQHLHAAHRTANHREQLGDTEMIDQAFLRCHHVADGDDGKVEPIGPTRRRIDRGGASRSHATADDIGADDVEPVGIDGFARPDQNLPPAGLFRYRVHVGDVLVARQGVADQDGVRFVGVELAVGLVCDRERRKGAPAIEGQRAVAAKNQTLIG